MGAQLRCCYRCLLTVPKTPPNAAGPSLELLLISCPSCQNAFQRRPSHNQSLCTASASSSRVRATEVLRAPRLGPVAAPSSHASFSAAGHARLAPDWLTSAG